MVKCSYPVCPNDSSINSSLSFHKFPSRTTNKPVWEAWIAILSQAKRKKVIKSKKCDEVICSHHFAAADFRQRRNGAPPALSPLAVPISPVSRSISFCDLETRVQTSASSLKQGTLFKFIADKKPRINALTPFLIKSASKGSLPVKALLACLDILHFIWILLTQFKLFYFYYFHPK